MPIDPTSPIELTAFARVPPPARGRVRDLRVRWALEESGLPYRVRLIGGIFGTPSGPPRPENSLTEQPFGQVPVCKEGALCLFESGAIVLHIGEKDERLLPRDKHGRARAIAWMIAALNSMEPFSLALLILNFSCADRPCSPRQAPRLSRLRSGGSRISRRRSARRDGSRTASPSAIS